VVVDSSNLVRYIQAVVDASLGDGIDAQMAAFREGFNEVGRGTEEVVAVVKLL
jgi:E3 ubiquitin-protein ligase TRIP12